MILIPFDMTLMCKANAVVRKFENEKLTFESRQNILDSVSKIQGFHMPVVFVFRPVFGMNCKLAFCKSQIYFMFNSILKL
jgi:hypothetical protein